MHFEGTQTVSDARFYSCEEELQNFAYSAKSFNRYVFKVIFFYFLMFPPPTMSLHILNWQHKINQDKILPKFPA